MKYRIEYLESVVTHDIPSLSTSAKRQIRKAIEDKLEALEKVKSSLASEEIAYLSLAEFLDGGDYGDLTARDITKAMKKIELSMAEQDRIIGDLRDSVSRLKGALAFLGIASE